MRSLSADLGITTSDSNDFSDRPKALVSALSAVKCFWFYDTVPVSHHPLRPRRGAAQTPANAC